MGKKNLEMKENLGKKRNQRKMKNLDIEQMPKEEKEEDIIFAGKIIY